jgi:hypothetical protein
MTTKRKLYAALGAFAVLLVAVLIFGPPSSATLTCLALSLGLMGTTITENPRVSDVLLWEDGVDINWTRSAITVVSGTVASAIGQVLGQVALGAASSAAKAGGNTASSGSLTLDVTTPVLANAKPGVYKVRCVKAAADAGTFVVTDPNGNAVGTLDAALTGGATFSNEIKFVLVSITSHDFVVGDGFDVTIAAGSGKYTQLTPAALDGTQTAAGVLITGASAITYAADASVVAVTRGPAICKLNGLAWTSGMSAGQKTTALAQLAALGIQVRTDYGV